MAKEGNRSLGPKHEIQGPCSDCKSATGPFAAVRRFGASGKGRIVRLCPKCTPKI